MGKNPKIRLKVVKAAAMLLLREFSARLHEIAVG